MFINNWEIIIRLLTAVVFAGVIGYEREVKGHDAGIRTHILVGLGAAIITMTQLEASEWLLHYSMQNENVAGILSSDIMRLTAQIVNGIGFLGAGTIIVSKRAVSGLTTAASIWAVAGLGIAVGMGYYYMALASTIIIFIVLRFVKAAFKIERTKRLVIRYRNKEKTSEYLKHSFSKYNISVLSTEFSISYHEDGSVTCQDVYTFHLPRDFDMEEFIYQIGDYPDILHINTIKAEVEN